MKNIHVKARLSMIHVADEIIMNEPYLTQVDMVIGDGDHDAGMKRIYGSKKYAGRKSNLKQLVHYLSQ